MVFCSSKKMHAGQLCSSTIFSKRDEVYYQQQYRIDILHWTMYLRSEKASGWLDRTMRTGTAQWGPWLHRAVRSWRPALLHQDLTAQWAEMASWTMGKWGRWAGLVGPGRALRAQTLWTRHSKQFWTSGKIDFRSRLQGSDVNSINDNSTAVIYESECMLTA